MNSFSEGFLLFHLALVIIIGYQLFYILFLVMLIMVLSARTAKLANRSSMLSF